MHATLDKEVGLPQVKNLIIELFIDLFVFCLFVCLFSIELGSSILSSHVFMFCICFGKLSCHHIHVHGDIVAKYVKCNCSNVEH